MNIGLGSAIVMSVILAAGCTTDKALLSVSADTPQNNMENSRAIADNDNAGDFRTPYNDADPSKHIATDDRILALNKELANDTPYFSKRSDTLDANVKKILKGNAKIILDYDIRFKIVGHADACDGEESDQRLSERRADNVKQEMLALGVPESLIVSVSGMGSSKPRQHSMPCSDRFNDRVDLDVFDPKGPESR